LDDQFQVYINRVLGMTRADSYRAQFSIIHASPKFEWDGASKWEPVPFPGCTLMTPPQGEDAVNQSFYEGLDACQQKLLAELPPGFIVPLPQASLHVTLADLLWADRYDPVAMSPEMATKLRQEIAQVLDAQPHGTGSPLRFQPLGFMVMPRALGVCLVPDTEATYQRVLALRRALYQHPALLALGVEQNYHLTLHITLGYFGQIPETADWDTLANRLVDLNQTALVGLPEFIIDRAELRQFDDMTRYYREPDWPVLDL
jgi:hypothetical protein